MKVPPPIVGVLKVGIILAILAWNFTTILGLLWVGSVYVDHYFGLYKESEEAQTAYHQRAQAAYLKIDSILLDNGVCKTAQICAGTRPVYILLQSKNTIRMNVYGIQNLMVVSQIASVLISEFEGEESVKELHIAAYDFTIENGKQLRDMYTTPIFSTEIRRP